MAGTEAEVPVTNPTTGEIRMVPREGVAAFTGQTGWHVATGEQREVAAENLESGSTGQQALAAGEQAVRTGTLGLVPGAEGWQQREKVLRRESPVVSGLAQGVGAVAPAVLTGGLAGGIAGGLGLGARGVGLAAAAGEGLAGGLSDEVEQARYESRDVSLGNVMMYGLGGELVGRALPHAFSMGAGRIRRALTGAEAAAGEGLTDALVGAEERAVRSQADVATELPRGSAERQQALRASAPEQYDRMASSAAEDLDSIAQLTGQDSSKKVTDRIKATLAEESPAQVEWVTGLKQKLSRMSDELGAPVEREAPVTVDEYLGTIKGTKAKAKALDDLTGEVLARAKERGLQPAVDEAALEYAHDAARRRLRGVADFTKDESIGALAGDIGERSPAAQALPNETKLAINQRMGKAKLEEVTAWTRDREALRGSLGEVPGAGREWSPLQAEELKRIQADILAERVPPKTLRQSAAGASKGVDELVDKTLRRLDKTTDTGEAFLIARDAKKQLQLLGDGITDSDAVRKLVSDADGFISAGLKDSSIFGAAADVEADISGPWSEKIRKGMGTAEGDLGRKVEGGVQFDPKKIRSFLQGDAIDRQLSQGKLEQVLEGAEEMAAAHERHGTWNPDQIQSLRDAVGRVRERLSLADELQAAKAEGKAAAAGAGEAAGGKAEKGLGQQAAEAVKGYAVSRAAGAAGAAAGGMIGGPVGAALGWGVGEVASSIGKRLVGIDAAARNATKQAARNLAGVGLGYAERVAGKAARSATGGGAAAGAMTALARFQGEFPDAQASFDAKRKVLDQQQLQPEVLYETLGSALGDLPKVRPDLFQAIAQRTSEKIRFIRENLPPGLQASLLYPNGTPPSHSDLRDVATLWNTVMDPETVLHDINAGTATQQQMGILKKSDPELYQQLRGDIIEMVGAHFKDVPTSTKASLDLLLGADGLAGPIFSSNAARFIGDATKAEQAQQQRPPPPPSSKAPAGVTPAGLTAIQTSVTNKQAA